MIINAYYYVSVLTSLTNEIDKDKIVFGDSKNRALLKRLAKAYSEQCDDLVIFGQVDDVPETVYLHGRALSVGYDDELNATYYLIDGNEILALVESPFGGFLLDKQSMPKV